MRTADRIVYESARPIIEQYVVHFAMATGDLIRLIERLREQAGRNGSGVTETSLRIDVRSEVLGRKQPQLAGFLSLVPLGDESSEE